MSELDEILKKLSLPFVFEGPGEELYYTHHWRPFKGKGNQRRIYAPYLVVAQVTKRLNDVLGLNWSSDIIRDGENTICELSIKAGDDWIKRSNIGTPSFEEKEKGSVSDSLKRAASMFGVGSYLKDIPNQVLSVKNINGSYYPVTRKDETPLYTADQVTAYLNGFSSAKLLLIQMAQQNPDLKKTKEFLELWKKT